MIVLRNKEFSDKFTRAIYGTRRFIKPTEGKIKSARAAIKSSKKIQDKAAEAVSDYVHVTDGKINIPKSITKTTSKIVENPVSGTAAVVVPGGGVAFPITSKIESKITPKKAKSFLSKQADKLRNNDKLADSIGNGINKVSTYGQALGFA